MTDKLRHLLEVWEIESLRFKGRSDEYIAAMQALSKLNDAIVTQANLENISLQVINHI